MSTYAAFLDQLRACVVTRVLPVDKENAPQPGQVFVGCGWHLPPGQDPAGWLVLNNKSTKERFGQKFTSVTRLVLQGGEKLFAGWELWTEAPLGPLEALDRMTLVVEDASPDSVFGVVMTLARLAHVELTEFPSFWSDAVDAWEQDGNADDPWTSWCALQSSLVHRHFPVGKSPESEHYQRAWTDALRFAAVCLQKGFMPYNIPALPTVPEWAGAQAAMRQEEQVYRDWFPHADIVQLSIPQTKVENRNLLVDGLLLTEDQPTGAAKVFYRNDREHSPLKKGFSFSAHYRPSEVGTGNDFTLAADTRSGIHLKGLRNLLEEMEDEAWRKAGEERPTDDPRRIDHMEDNKYNQPWFINENASIIGAPRKLKDGRFGTKLTWSDVLIAIWTAYNPLRGIEVHPRGSVVPTPLVQLRPLPSEGHHKRILACSWIKGREDQIDDKARALSGSPLIPRALAALISPKNTGLPDLDTLPRQDNWRRIDLKGGFAIVTMEGALVLDDWRNEPLAMDLMCDTIGDAAMMDAKISTQAERVGAYAQRVDTLYKKKFLAGEQEKPQKTSWNEIEDLIRQATCIGVDLAGLRGMHATPCSDPDARALRKALDEHWSLDSRLDALESQVRSMESALRTLNGLRTERILRKITIHGFLLVFAATLAPVLGNLSGSHKLWWANPVWFLWLAITLFFIVHLWGKKEEQVHHSPLDRCEEKKE